MKAEGEGVHSYDYKHDVLMFKIKERFYDRSEEFDRVVVDIDEEGFITGLQIFDASELLDVSKKALNNIENFKFDVEVKENVLTIKLSFDAKKRNKPVKAGQNIIRENSKTNLKDSRVICTV